MGEEISPSWGAGGGRGWSFAVTGQSWMWMLCAHTHTHTKDSRPCSCKSVMTENLSAGVGVKPRAPAGVQTLLSGPQGLREPSVHMETGSAASVMSICSPRLGLTESSLGAVSPCPGHGSSPEPSSQERAQLPGSLSSTPVAKARLGVLFSTLTFRYLLQGEKLQGQSQRLQARSSLSRAPRKELGTQLTREKLIQLSLWAEGGCAPQAPTGASTAPGEHTTRT